MTLTGILTAVVLLALTGTVVLDVYWARRKRFGPVVGISVGFIVFVSILYAVLMEFITRM